MNTKKTNTKPNKPLDSVAGDTLLDVRAELEKIRKYNVGLKLQNYTEKQAVLMINMSLNKIRSLIG